MMKSKVQCNYLDHSYVKFTIGHDHPVDFFDFETRGQQGNSEETRHAKIPTRSSEQLEHRNTNFRDAIQLSG